MKENFGNKQPKETGDKNTIRFVKIQFTETNRFHGHFVRSAKCETFGLQINEKIYLVDGRYKYSGGKQLKIIEEYPPYPSWATEELRKMYDIKKGQGDLFDLLGL